MILSYCTTCHGRLWQLKQTLPSNLKYTESGKVELFIAIFNDQEVVDYISKHYFDYIHDGRLKYIVINEDRLWSAAYVKNIAHFNSTGSIVFNLDGDNFIDDGLHSTLLKLTENQIVVPNVSNTINGHGAIGRIGMFRTLFNRLGGYKTRIGSSHDGDIVMRAIRMNKQSVRVSCMKEPIDNPFEICIIGCGYVGLASAQLLNKYHKQLVDVKQIDVPDTITKFRFSKYPAKAPIYVVCLPTPLGDTNTLDTHLIDDLLESIKYPCDVIIRSTLPIGYCDRIMRLYPNLKITYIPEFFREHNYLNDVKNPDRVIIAGEYNVNIFDFDQSKIQRVSHTEAETIKLVSNSYLAMRLVFFKDIKDFCVDQNINFENVLMGIVSDKRIGNLYNAEPLIPSGKCLPKDTITTANSLSSDLIKIIAARVVVEPDK